MKHEVQLHIAQIILATDYEARTRAKEEAVASTSDADAIIAAAEAQAKSIIAAAEARAKDMDADLKRISDEALSQFLDTNAVDGVAKAVKTTLETAKYLRDDFDNFAPWMTQFVEAVILRITGQVPPKALWSAVLSQSLKDVRDRWDIVLRCHPSREVMFTQLLSSQAELAKYIKAIAPDRDMGIDKCHLVTARGVLDISIDTQVTTVLTALDELVQADTHGAGVSA